MPVSASRLASFDFRQVHPQLFIGTMSDRYAGWLGQIYSEDKYEGRISTRTKTLKGNIFTEEVLPADSVREYFEHFPVLEIDFTFYRPLRDKEGNATQNYHVLRKYREQLKPGDRIFLKVPQMLCAPKLRRKEGFVQNPSYLNPEIFLRGFYEPAHRILDDHLCGLIFEQAYQRKDEKSTSEMLARDLDVFFRKIPRDRRYHMEIRTERLLAEPVFAVLKKHGVGLVLSQWTWLPSLRTQFQKSGIMLSGDDSLAIRLVTPRGKTYDETYAAAHPFDVMVEGMLHPSVVEETVEIIRGVVQRGSRLYLFINNRAGGNAPKIAQNIAQRLTNDSHSNSSGIHS
ncbi:MAG: DUF72 domain-containing protein [Candidatus Aminicenantes bacterium]|nr:DUF72 domain-containing protein [Candidatus Aminicenantes bacterium]